MNNIHVIMPGGGPFSRFLQCGVIPLADVEFDNVFLELSPFVENDATDEYSQVAVNYIVHNTRAMMAYGIDRPYQHIMNFVTDQKFDETFRYHGFLPVGTWYDRDRPIEHSERLGDYKRVLKKIHIKNEIKTRVDNLCKLVNIGEQTLGVHVRLTTMDLHTHIPATIEHYFETIDRELESGRWNGIYVSTDNVESLVKMEQRYSRWIRYYPNLLRLPKETIGNDNEWAWEYDMFFHKRFWQESFMEVMTLARCGGLVCRDSNFSNAAVVFSDTIKSVIRVGSL